MMISKIFHLQVIEAPLASIILTWVLFFKCKRIILSKRLEDCQVEHAKALANSKVATAKVEGGRILAKGREEKLKESLICC